MLLSLTYLEPLMNCNFSIYSQKYVTLYTNQNNNQILTQATKNQQDNMHNGLFYLSPNESSNRMKLSSHISLPQHPPTEVLHQAAASSALAPSYCISCEPLVGGTWDIINQLRYGCVQGNITINNHGEINDSCK